MGARSSQLARGVAYTLTVPPTLIYTAASDKVVIVKYLGATNNGSVPITGPADVFLSVGPSAGKSRVFSVGFAGGISDPTNPAIFGTFNGFPYFVMEPLDELWIGSVSGGSYDFLVSGSVLDA